MENNCPKCGELNSDNWPITVDEIIQWGGCQTCWETESDAQWWDTVIAYEKVMEQD